MKSSGNSVGLSLHCTAAVAALASAVSSAEVGSFFIRSEENFILKRR